MRDANSIVQIDDLCFKEVVLQGKEMVRAFKQIVLAKRKR